MAELTVTRLQQRIARSMGWRRPADWPSELEPLEVANTAGEWLYSIYDWECLRRPLVQLDLIGGQGYIALPADFGRLVRLRGALNRAATVDLQDIQAVLDSRSATPANPQTFTGCIVHTRHTPNGPRSMPVIEIGPVPTTSTMGLFLLAYRAGWVDVVDGHDHITVPSWMEALYVQVATSYVQGLEQERDGTVEARWDRILGSSLMLAAQNRDGTIETELGQMRGGVGEMFGGGDDETPIGLNRTAPIIVSP